MAKSLKVSQESVAREADRLVATGQRPTIERIRLALGGGSPNTIAPFLNKWFEELGQRLTGEPVPASMLTVPPAVMRFYEAVREDVRAQVEQRLADSIAAARAATEHAERQAQMDRQARQHIELEMAGLRESGVKQAKTIDQLQSSLETSRRQLETQLRRIAELEAQVVDAARQSADERRKEAAALAEANQRAADAKAQAEIAKARATDAHTRAADAHRQHMLDLDAERTAHKETKKRGERLAEQLAKAQSNSAEQRTKAAEAAAQMKVELATAQRLVNSLSEELAKAKADLEEQGRRAEADQRRLAELTAENTLLRERQNSAESPAPPVLNSAPPKVTRRVKASRGRKRA